MALPPLYRFAACAFLVACAVSLHGQTAATFTFDNAQAVSQDLLCNLSWWQVGHGWIGRGSIFHLRGPAEEPQQVGADSRQGAEL